MSRGSDREDVLAWISRPEGVWQCTTCMACVEACPAGIEHMPAIIAERRMLIEKGDIDPLLQQLRGATPTREERTWRRTEALHTLGPGQVEVHDIDFLTFELNDGPGVNPANVGRKLPHAAIL